MLHTCFSKSTINDYVPVGFCYCGLGLEIFSESFFLQTLGKSMDSLCGFGNI